MVLGLFGKTEIAVIYHGILTSCISNEIKKLFPLMCRVNADVIRFIPQNIKIVFFHFYFLNQDFFLTIISITLLLFW